MNINENADLRPILRLFVCLGVRYHAKDGPIHLGKWLLTAPSICETIFQTDKDRGMIGRANLLRSWVMFSSVSLVFKASSSAFIETCLNQFGNRFEPRLNFIFNI